jgi:hypothetical protein
MYNQLVWPRQLQFQQAAVVLAGWGSPHHRELHRHPRLTKRILAQGEAIDYDYAPVDGHACTPWWL